MNVYMYTRNDEDELPALSWRSWVVLATFVVVTVFVICPVRFMIPLPKPSAVARCLYRRQRLNSQPNSWWFVQLAMDMKLVPWLGVLVLLASTTIRFGSEVVRGFVGGDGIEPYSILILVFALAYICVSLDESGLLSYIAVKVTGRWGRNGRVLLLCFYALSAIMAVITNNDTVVLCLTPIICVFADTTGASAEPFLIAMFVAANTASMALFIGNPTNIIVAEANDISFLSYSAWMGLPFLGAAAAGLVVVYIASRNKIAHDIPVDLGSHNRPRDIIRRKQQAVLGAGILVSCLVALSVSSFFGVAVWIVTLPFGVAMLVVDAVADLSMTRNSTHPSVVVLPAPPVHTLGSAEAIQMQPCGSADSVPTTIVAASTPEDHTGVGEPFEDRFTRAIQRTNHRCRSVMELRVPTIYAVFQRLPYGIIPFALGMFIIVESLSSQGWTPRLAWALVRICTTTASAVFVVGIITALSCNILNNLPMSILFSRALQHPIFAQVDGNIRRGAMFALIIGSNVGANFTLVGSLAGLMFQRIASQKKRDIGYFRFLRWCAPVMAVQLAVACAILLAELAIIN
ncbi:hypothetical protein GGF46_002987 [Coemansia sp. RSA 552]|nr:hypothetical protein GGF46_002987 [Coemansia sp. RSA 552]